MSDSTEPLVLVVEDEPQVMRFLRATLPGNGYRLVEAPSGATALVEASTRSPDLILLDLGLPDLDGIEVTRRIREWSQVPIIVLSARGQESDKIQALDAGADDYLTKPFAVGELMARMRVALRNASRRGAEPEAVFEVGDLRVDLAARRVYKDGEEVRLTRTEYGLLAVLVRHAGRVLTHRQLLNQVWGPGSVGQSHYLRVYMAQLRHKLEKDPARPRHLVTETGVGYRLKSE
ncbi:MAG TPA: response regulator [Vicinamibacteria bacterium]|nr:response regulator [Vicinamibacteria bacterium]